MTQALRCLLALATIAIAACDASPEPEPFKYDLTRSNGLDVEAHDAKGPLRGVVVSVRTPSPGPGLTGELLWIGATGSDGHARALFRTDRAGDSLDVTLHKAGWRGPWTDDSLRQSQGITAPSSRLTVPIAQLDSVHVDLERSE